MSKHKPVSYKLFLTFLMSSGHVTYNDHLTQVIPLMQFCFGIDEIHCFEFKSECYSKLIINVRADPDRWTVRENSSIHIPIFQLFSCLFNYY